MSLIPALPKCSGSWWARGLRNLHGGTVVMGRTFKGPAQSTWESAVVRPASKSQSLTRLLGVTQWPDDEIMGGTKKRPRLACLPAQVPMRCLHLEPRVRGHGVGMLGPWPLFSSTRLFTTPPGCTCGEQNVTPVGQNAKCPVHDSKRALPAGLEEAQFAMGLWSVGLGAVGAAIIGIILANTDLLLTSPVMATLEFLEDADLKSTTDDSPSFKAKTLWEKSGAVIMAEAAELSSLKPQLEELGVPLYAVVKESIDTEIQDFRPFFAGDIFLDEKKSFYGQQPRRMGGMGLFRVGVWSNFRRAWKGGYEGNMKGEGFILGGVYVIGAGKQGILLEHQEKEFGDKVDMASVLEAAKKVVVEK